MRRRLAVAIALAVVLVPAAIARDTPKLQFALDEVRRGTLAEQNALVALGKHPPDWKAVEKEAFSGDIYVGGANVQLHNAVEAGEVDSADISAISKDLTEALRNDGKAYDAAKKKDAAAVKRLLREALPYKHAAQSKLETLIDSSSVRRCEVEKPFQVFAIPEGYAGSYADVFPHGIPQNAKHLKVSFVDLATGKAPAAEVFPGQTWKATVKGYRPDGKFDVRIDVSGTGFGQPDANVKSWKVVVTYDCP